MLFNSTVIGSNYFQGGGGGEIAGYKGLSSLNQLAPSTFGDRRHRGIIVESSKSASPLLWTAKRDGGDNRDARFRHLYNTVRPSFVVYKHADTLPSI